MIVKVSNTDKKELTTLWLADKVYAIIGDAVNSQDILNVVNGNIVKYGREI